MTDYLLVHGAGQGAWSWGRVWGYLTAPPDHPPRLYSSRLVTKVYPLDLPGHGAEARGATALVSLEECVQAIKGCVESQGMKDLVLVGHGFAASLVLQAARQLAPPPKRLVLVAGVVPPHRGTMLGVLPRRVRAGFRFLSALSRISRQEFRVPRSVITKFLCNGMDTMEVVQAVGLFGPVPTRVLTTTVALEPPDPPCPVTYVVLTRDRILPPDLQHRMAQGVAGVEVVQVESCHQVMLHQPRALADILLRYA